MKIKRDKVNVPKRKVFSIGRRKVTVNVADIIELKGYLCLP